MDAISLVQTVLPLAFALVFTIMTAYGLVGLLLEQPEMLLTPLWCLLAAVFWTGATFLNIYATTTDYLSLMGYVYGTIAVIHWVLVPITVLMSVKIVATNRKLKNQDDEMRIE